LLFAWLQSTYHLIPLSEQNYYLAYAPVEPHAIDFLLVSVVTLLLCTLSSYLPARTAANTNPLKVIAYGRYTRTNYSSRSFLVLYILNSPDHKPVFRRGGISKDLFKKHAMPPKSAIMNSSATDDSKPCCLSASVDP